MAEVISNVLGVTVDQPTEIDLDADTVNRAGLKRALENRRAIATLGAQQAALDVRITKGH
jgi:hypothetical protein